MRSLLTTMLLITAGIGSYLFQPVSIPKIDVRPMTPQQIEDGLKAEQRQKVFNRAVRVSTRLYQQYRCSGDLADITAEVAMQYNLPVLLATAVVIQESGCHATAKSKAGAIGYWQIMPEMHGVSRTALYDRDTNFHTGAKLLAYLIHRFRSIDEGLANYFGVTPGSDKAYDYAYRVQEIAGIKT